MVRMTWSSLSASTPAFLAYRRDDAVVRTLQGSQVAVHEYRLAYDNLLAATKRERDDLVRDKLRLEDELHSLTIAKAEADRLLKGQISGLHEGLRASEKAYSELDAEHQRLQHASAEVTTDLLQRVDSLHQAVSDLQMESQSLQSQLVSAQADAATKDSALRQVAELQSAMSALQQRARQLVSDLKQGKDTAEKRAAELSNNLSTTKQQLAKEAAARASNDDAIRRLAWERQQLASALELERLINEPLRHCHYATTTTLAHVLRSPVAPTVRDRASPDRRMDRIPHQQQPQEPGQHFGPLAPPYSPDQRRPGSAPAAAANTIVQELGGGSTTCSPLPRRRKKGSLGAVTGRNLTRLGRSWATTTTVAAPHNPLFQDNLHSPLSPPPPGPPRKPVALVTPSYTAGTARLRSGGGGGGNEGGGTPRSASTTGHRYMSPQYLTAMLRSPQTPYVHDSTAWRAAETPSEGARSPAFLWGVPSSPSPSQAMSQARATAGAGTTASPSRIGRMAMREAVKEAGSSGGTPPVILTPGGSPITIVYG